MPRFARAKLSLTDAYYAPLNVIARILLHKNKNVIGLCQATETHPMSQ